MSAVADVRGLKRICGDCGVRFYDLNKRPIICPSCGTEFDGEVKVKSRRGRSAAVPEDTAMKPAEAEALKAKAADDDELEEEDEGAEIVSLDDDAVVADVTSDEDSDKVPSLDSSDDSDDEDDLPDLSDDLVSLDDLEDEDSEEEDEDPA